MDQESEAHRVPLAHLAHRVQRGEMVPLAPQASLSRANQGTQDQWVFRVLLGYQVQGDPKEKKAAQGSRVIVVLMDSASQDHLGLLGLLDLFLICRICSSMLQGVFSTSLRSEDHQDPWALKACMAELDFLAPEDPKETKGLQVYRGHQGSREKKENPG